jgi:FkbH-like protein
MKLSTALQTLAGARKDLPEKNLYLACGFTPLHLQTFLAAHVQIAEPESRTSVMTGLYGDLIGNVSRTPPGVRAVAVIEWSDLDPRLGYRNLAAWNSSNSDDILASLPSRLDVLAEHIEKASHHSPFTVVLPSVPMAPISHAPHWMADRLSLGARRLLADFADRLMEPDRVRILNSDALARFDGEVFQLRSELENGFPYSLAYADFLAQTISLSVVGLRPKKALITDLDNTLWAGIIGEDGCAGVQWTMEGGAQIHGLYQLVLASLAEAGVLIGIASKNDPSVVEDALSRLPLAVTSEQMFPRVVNWDRKSLAVGSILRAWNIGPQDVVFVDDSANELEEVERAFPQMTCLQFKGADVSYSLDLLLQLRTLFGKARLREEDALRAASLRVAGQIESEKGSAPSEDAFLAGLRSRLMMSVETDFVEGRALELVNKTNQFNLNGRRFDLPAWQRLQQHPGRFLVTADYLDKHGSLGKISVLTGVLSGDTFRIDSWVLSCRAFSRRIEHAMLDFLFRRFELRAIDLEYVTTPRNGPILDFIRQLLGDFSEGTVRIERDRWREKCLPLFHEFDQTARGHA